MGARKARDAKAIPNRVGASEPEFEAICIMHIYWTLLRQRKGRRTDIAVHHRRTPCRTRAELFIPATATINSRP
jgi:hypothetical protein